MTQALHTALQHAVVAKTIHVTAKHSAILKHYRQVKLARLHFPIRLRYHEFCSRSGFASRSWVRQGPPSTTLARIFKHNLRPWAAIGNALRHWNTLRCETVLFSWFWPRVWDWRIRIINMRTYPTSVRGHTLRNQATNNTVHWRNVKFVLDWRLTNGYWSWWNYFSDC